MDDDESRSAALEEHLASMLRKPTPSQILVPPRASGEGVFKAGNVSPSPMTLAASFLVDHDPDTEFRSFTSLMTSTPASPSFSISPCKARPPELPPMSGAGGKDMTREMKRARSSFGELLVARGGATSSSSRFALDPSAFPEDVKPFAAQGNAMPPSQIPTSWSGWLTIPPGISPTTLLDSPVLFSSHQVELSPTTGSYNLPSAFGSGRAVQMSPHSSESSKESEVEQESSSGFVFKPLPKQGSLNHLPSHEDLISFGVSPPQDPVHFEQHGGLRASASRMQLSAASMAAPSIQAASGFHSKSMSVSDGQQEASEASSSPLEDMQGLNQATVERPSEDGYNWRKYGQKQVKGSEFPRSYYKCTSANCPVKKKVERSHDGQVTEIVYKSEHNHLKPVTSRRLHGSAVASHGLPDYRSGRDHSSSLLPIKDGGAYTDLRSRNFQGLPPPREVGGFERTSSRLRDNSGSLVDPSGNHELSGLSYSDDEDQGSRLSTEDVDEDGSSPKRRRMESLTAENAAIQRTIREPRVVVQTRSEIDILIDGYRWRKYGQKVVKGNPHPRSYYKCTNIGCPVRKHVERASNDPRSVITTYEGKHNHDVPVAKAGAIDNSANEASSLLAQTETFASCVNSLAPSASIHDQTSKFPGKTAAIGSSLKDDCLNLDMNMSNTDLGMQLGIERPAFYVDDGSQAIKQEAFSFSTSNFMNFADVFPSNEG